MDEKSSVVPLLAAYILTTLTYSNATAEPVQQSNLRGSGNESVEERLVYDVTIKIWWYPDLMAMADKTRKEQLRAIEALNKHKCGNISEWCMSSIEVLPR